MTTGKEEKQKSYTKFIKVPSRRKNASLERRTFKKWRLPKKKIIQ